MDREVMHEMTNEGVRVDIYGRVVPATAMWVCHSQAHAKSSLKVTVY